MSAIRLYFDADAMQRAVVRGLQARGIDVTTAHQVGLAYGADEDQLDYARKEGRVLFSYNVSDFFRIHTQLLSKGTTHAGIVLAPQQQYGIGERIRRTLKLISSRSAEEMQNRIEFLSEWD